MLLMGHSLSPAAELYTEKRGQPLQRQMYRLNSLALKPCRCLRKDLGACDILPRMLYALATLAKSG